MLYEVITILQKDFDHTDVFFFQIGSQLTQLAALLHTGGAPGGAQLEDEQLTFMRGKLEILV